jgi:hypothetical protein
VRLLKTKSEGLSAQYLLSCIQTHHTPALPRSSQRETEPEQRKQLVILIPNKVSSTHPRRKIVSSPENRAKPANRRETTVVKRMASGYGGDAVKVVEVAIRQNTYGVMEMRTATSALILVHPYGRFVGQ